MSVQVKNLTKIYGTQRAINGISFEVQPGEVLGFLGPNGAGKTTTMKILTCFIQASEGEAFVCGHNVNKDPLEVRRQIGYLPEHNPLYKDMYVREYLRFVAGMHKVANPAGRVKEVIEVTGLGIEQHKLIGQLSKGYRQRVGLAQAIIHDPQVLILDEPTSGLDPNQIIEIRKVIKDLGNQKTVIFSTHIMQEVQALCDRVVIINRGNIVADDKMENLQQQLTGGSVVTVEFGNAVSAKQLQALPNVRKVTLIEGNRYQIAGPADVDLRKVISDFALENKIAVLEMRRDISSAEDVFAELTTKTDHV